MIFLDFLPKILYYIYVCAKTYKEVIIIKIDKTIRKEIAFVGIWTLILSGIMQAVFLIIGKWDYTVLLGNLLSGAMGLVNLFLLGLTIQKALNSGDEKYAKNLMKMSQSLRLLMMAAVVALGGLLDCFNFWATIIPVFFPRIALTIRQIVLKKQGGNQNE